ncbi:hypothetical protein ACFWRC_05630 [Streptomyces albidoflavus]
MRMRFTARRRLGTAVTALALAVLPTAPQAAAEPSGAGASERAAAPTLVVGPVSADGEASVASCPEGTRAVNGGYASASFQHANGGSIYDAVLASAPTKDGKGWFASQLKGKVQARALCAPEGQAPTLVVGPVSADGEASVASCPEGTRAVNGGFASASFQHANGGTIYDFLDASAPTKDGKGWFATQLKGKVQARALCAPAERAPSLVVGPVSADGEASVASCPDGTRAVNGGYASASFRHANGGTIYDAVLASAPTKDGKGWFANQLKGEVQARALCAPEDQAPTLVVGPVSADGEASVASCPDGTRAVNGGYASASFQHANGGEIYDYVTAGAPTKDGKGWFAGQLKGKVQARALCLATG